MGGLIARQALDKAGSVELYDADEVPDEWLVATIGGVGAPSVLAEKGINGCEITNLLAAQEEQLGRKLDAIVLSEIGGMNSVIPVAAAAIAGIPLVNVDGMGRAFPGCSRIRTTLPACTPGLWRSPMKKATWPCSPRRQ